VILPLLALAVLTAAQAQASASRTALAAVVNGRNQPIVDLGPDDFVIKEGRDAREILSVHMADYPLALVIDNRGGAHPELEAIRKAALRFVARIGQDRPLVVAVLGSSPPIVAGLDDDKKAVNDRLNQLAVGEGGKDIPLRALAESAAALKSTGALFSAIIVVAAAPAEVAGERADELLSTAFASGARVFAIENRTMPPAPGAESHDLFQSFAQQSGGQFTPIYSAASFQAALDRLADRFSTEMMIDYIVPAGSDSSDVKIGVRVPGARVRGLGVAPR
jgi:hypothetical protein